LLVSRTQMVLCGGLAGWRGVSEGRARWFEQDPTDRTDLMDTRIYG